jgi:hypothetical protein
MSAHFVSLLIARRRLFRPPGGSAWNSLILCVWGRRRRSLRRILSSVVDDEPRRRRRRYRGCLGPFLGLAPGPSVWRPRTRLVFRSWVASFRAAQPSSGPPASRARQSQSATRVRKHSIPTGGGVGQRRAEDVGPSTLRSSPTTPSSCGTTGTAPSAETVGTSRAKLCVRCLLP